jgi:hypothetical protein
LKRQGDNEPVGAGLVSDDERNRLHELLDRILDQRENLDGWRAEPAKLSDLLPPSLNPDRDLLEKLADRGARLAFEGAITLAVDALGSARTQSLVGATSDPEGIRWALWLRLNQVRRLIEGRTPLLGKSDFPLSQVLEELENLSYGEISEIFRAAPLKPSQRHNRGKLAKLRLKALAWEKWLRASQSMTAFDSHMAVSEAYRTDWDAIRKWRTSCIKILGPTKVKFSLQQAAAGHQPAYTLFGDWKTWLTFDGESYQRALREEPPNRTA